MKTPFPMGPDMYGAWYLPTNAHFDGTRTTAEFRSGTYGFILNCIEERDAS